MVHVWSSPPLGDNQKAPLDLNRTCTLTGSCIKIMSCVSQINSLGKLIWVVGVIFASPPYAQPEAECDGLFRRMMRTRRRDVVLTLIGRRHPHRYRGVGGVPRDANTQGEVYRAFVTEPVRGAE